MFPKENPLFKSDHIGSIRATIWDLSSQALPEDIKEGSVDIILMIFVLSALHPNEWDQAVVNVHKVRRIPKTN